MPTRTQTEAWRTTALSDWADRIAAGDTAYVDQLDRARTHFTNTGESWSGAAYDAAYDRIGEERDEGRKLSFEVLEFVAALRNAATRLSDERRILLGLVTSAEAETLHGAKFFIGDNWSTSVQYPDTADTDQRNEITGRAFALQDGITTAYNSFVAAIVEVNNTIKTQGDEVRSRGDHLATATFVDGPEGWTTDRALTSELGDEDGENIADGKLSDAEAARIAARLARAGMTPEQLQAVANGEDVTVPAATMDYLNSFYDKAGRDGLLTVSDKLAADGSPTSQQLRTSMANGLLTVSNENVVVKDRNGQVTDRGGWKNVDPEVRAMIESRGYPLPSEDLTSFAGLLSEADPGYQPGDKLGVELIEQAAFQVNAADSPGGEMHAGVQSQLMGETAVQDLLAVGARNTDSSHALITGEGSEELLGPGYKPESVAPLFQHTWDDKGQALSGMYNWVEDDARVPPNSVEDATKAGETARGLADLMSNTKSSVDGSNLYETWLNMPGADGQSFGAVNPIAAQSMAEALSPYAGNFVGVDSGLLDTAGFGGMNPYESTRVFSILNGDPIAGATINGAAIAEAERFDRMFANTASGEDNDPRFAKYSSHLNWLTSTGITMEQTDRQIDADTAKKEYDQRISAAYTASQIMLGGAGPIGVGVAATSEFPKSEILEMFSKEGEYIGPHSNVANPSGIGGSAATFSTLDLNTDDRHRYAMMQGLIESGRLDPSEIPESFISDDGTVKSYFDVLAESRAGAKNDVYSSQSVLTVPLNDILRGAQLGTPIDSHASQVGRAQQNMNELLSTNTGSDAKNSLDDKLRRASMSNDPRNYWR